MRYVFDCDAWHCARTLRTNDSSILDLVLSSSECTPVVLTDYVKHHELSTLSREIDPHVASGRIICERVPAADANYKRLRREVHKGEASCIAWLLALTQQREIVFVTRDTGAAKAATKEKLLCTDVLGLVLDMIAVGAVMEQDAQFALSIWDDKSQSIGRPADWKGFAETSALRRQHGFPFFRMR